MANRKTTAVAVKGTSAVSTEFKGMFNKELGMGAGENVDSEDILIPKIHLAQALTPQVSDGKIKVGEYMDSIDKSSIGPKVDVYIMSNVKLMQVSYLVRTKKKVTKEYLGTIDYDKSVLASLNKNILTPELLERAKNKGLSPELELETDKILRFYVVRVDEVERGEAFPYIIDFKRSSYPSGKELQTKFARMRTQGLPSYAKVFSVSSEFIQEELDYYVKKVSVGRDITQNELGAVETWVKELRSNSAKYSADESMDEQETTAKDVSPKMEDQPGQPNL